MKHFATELQHGPGTIRYRYGASSGYYANGIPTSHPAGYGDEATEARARISWIMTIQHAYGFPVVDVCVFVCVLCAVHGCKLAHDMFSTSNRW